MSARPSGYPSKLKSSLTNRKTSYEPGDTYFMPHAGNVSAAQCWTMISEAFRTSIPSIL